MYVATAKKRVRFSENQTIHFFEKDNVHEESPAHSDASARHAPDQYSPEQPTLGIQKQHETRNIDAVSPDFSGSLPSTAPFGEGGLACLIDEDEQEHGIVSPRIRVNQDEPEPGSEQDSWLMAVGGDCDTMIEDLELAREFRRKVDEHPEVSSSFTGASGELLPTPAVQYPVQHFEDKDAVAELEVEADPEPEAEPALRRKYGSLACKHPALRRNSCARWSHLVPQDTSMLLTDDEDGPMPTWASQASDSYGCSDSRHDDGSPASLSLDDGGLECGASSAACVAPGDEAEAVDGDVLAARLASSDGGAGEGDAASPLTGREPAFTLAGAACSPAGNGVCEDCLGTGTSSRRTGSSRSRDSITNLIAGAVDGCFTDGCGALEAAADACSPAPPAGYRKQSPGAVAQPSLIVDAATQATVAKSASADGEGMPREATQRNMTTNLLFDGGTAMSLGSMYHSGGGVPAELGATVALEDKTSARAMPVPDNGAGSRVVSGDRGADDRFNEQQQPTTPQRVASSAKPASKRPRGADAASKPASHELASSAGTPRRHKAAAEQPSGKRRRSVSPAQKPRSTTCGDGLKTPPAYATPRSARALLRSRGSLTLSARRAQAMRNAVTPRSLPPTTGTPLVTIREEHERDSMRSPGALRSPQERMLDFEQVAALDARCEPADASLFQLPVLRSQGDLLPRTPPGAVPICMQQNGDSGNAGLSTPRLSAVASQADPTRVSPALGAMPSPSGKGDAFVPPSSPLSNVSIHTFLRETGLHDALASVQCPTAWSVRAPHMPHQVLAAASDGTLPRELANLLRRWQAAVQEREELGRTALQQLQHDHSETRRNLDADFSACNPRLFHLWKAGSQGDRQRMKSLLLADLNHAVGDQAEYDHMHERLVSVTAPSLSALEQLQASLSRSLTQLQEDCAASKDDAAAAERKVHQRRAELEEAGRLRAAAEAADRAAADEADSKRQMLHLLQVQLAGVCSETQTLSKLSEVKRVDLAAAEQTVSAARAAAAGEAAAADEVRAAAANVAICDARRGFAATAAHLLRCCAAKLVNSHIETVSGSAGCATRQARLELELSGQLKAFLTFASGAEGPCCRPHALKLTLTRDANGAEQNAQCAFAAGLLSLNPVAGAYQRQESLVGLPAASAWAHVKNASDAARTVHAFLRKLSFLNLNITMISQRPSLNADGTICVRFTCLRHTLMASLAFSVSLEAESNTISVAYVRADSVIAVSHDCAEVQAALAAALAGSRQGVDALHCLCEKARDVLLTLPERALVLDRVRPDIADDVQAAYDAVVARLRGCSKLAALEAAPVPTAQADAGAMPKVAAPVSAEYASLHDSVVEEALVGDEENDIRSAQVHDAQIRDDLTPVPAALSPSSRGHAARTTLSSPDDSRSRHLSIQSVTGPFPGGKTEYGLAGTDSSSSPRAAKTHRAWQTNYENPLFNDVTGFRKSQRG